MERTPLIALMAITKVRAMAASGEARRSREHARLSLGEMAKGVGVSRQTIMRWENGEARPAGDPAVRWFEILTELEAVAA